MVDYRVNLDIFAGPMDLLLYLVRKEEVDIYDIPIAKITNQYLKYVEILKNLDIDLAGDFLVLAATLMEIKSAMLLPQVEPEQVEADPDEDPRAELVRQLLEYKKYKDAANLLNAAADQQGERFNRPDNIISKLNKEQEPDVDIDQINVWDLLEAFDAVCRATGQLSNIRNIKDDTPIDLYQIELLTRLQEEGSMTFQRVFSGQPNRLVMIGLFLALLELVRGKLVWVGQMEDGTDLYMRPLTDEPAEIAVNRIILAVEEEAQQDIGELQEENDTLQAVGELQDEDDELQELGELQDEDDELQELGELQDEDDELLEIGELQDEDDELQEVGELQDEDDETQEVGELQDEDDETQEVGELQEQEEREETPQARKPAESPIPAPPQAKTPPIPIAEIPPKSKSAKSTGRVEQLDA